MEEQPNPIKTRLQQKRNLAIALALLCSAIVIVLFEYEIFEPVELNTLDVRSRLFAEKKDADTNIVIIAIDESSLYGIKKENNVVWPWPRDLYAALVDYLHHAGAKMVIFDILFTDPDIDRLSSDGIENDRKFAEAMKQAGNVILPGQLLKGNNTYHNDNPINYRQNLSIVGHPGSLKNEEYSSHLFPIPMYQDALAGIGMANYYADPEDGTCRRTPVMFPYNGSYYPQLGFSAYLKTIKADTVTIEKKLLRIRNRDIPVDQDGNFLIKWYGKGGTNGCFNYYPIASVILSQRDILVGEKPRIDPVRFKDKYVFIGSTAAGLLDFKNTPFTGYEPYPGLEISATILSNLLKSDYLTRNHTIVPLTAIVLFSLIISLSFVLLRKVREVVVLMLACMALWSGIALLGFAYANSWIDVVAPNTAMILSFAAMAVVSYSTEWRERNRLRSIFSHYVGQEVISEIVEKSETIDLGGKDVQGTILFTDIKNFTNISEDIGDPHKLVEMMNIYFGSATECIFRNKGLLDKYIGDSIMAIFGAPVPLQNHGWLACNTALEIQKLLEEQRHTLLSAYPELFTRFGINTGKMIVGNIGSLKRMNYTALGDSVNLASRLETANKTYHTNILISEYTLKEVADLFVVRPLDKITVMGKTKPVSIYELVGKPGEVSDERLEAVNQFRSGLNFYFERNFRKAKRVFEEILKNHKEDGPSEIFRMRCEAYIKTPPAKTWDGTYTMTSK
ncbi:MAG: adenylate/guanylate cyclase domain-containing protein [bacterium]